MFWIINFLCIVMYTRSNIVYVIFLKIQDAKKVMWMLWFDIEMNMLYRHNDVWGCLFKGQPIFSKDWRCNRLTQKKFVWPQKETVPTLIIHNHHWIFASQQITQDRIRLTDRIGKISIKIEFIKIFFSKNICKNENIFLMKK